MNRITRMLTITGLGVFAGVTIGAGPAMAATNTGQGAVKSSTTTVTAKPGDRVAGYYDTREECRLAGRIGDRLGRWDDWDCYPAGGGWHHGDWVLVVDYHWHGGFPFHHHGGFPFPFHHGGIFHHQGDGDWKGDGDGGWKGDKDGDWKGDKDGDWKGDKDGGWKGDKDGGWKGGQDGGSQNNVGMPTAQPAGS